MLFVLGTAAPYPAPPSFGEATGGGLGCGLLISEFYSSALSNDEYIVVTSCVDSYVSLANWSISDGEGSICIKSWLLPPRSSVSVGFNSTSFGKAYGRCPNIALDQADECESAVVIGSFRLADAGDSMSLVNPMGQLEDCVAYGDETCDGWTGPPIPKPRQGEVVKRICEGDASADTNTSSDWLCFREYRYGYTSIEPVSAVVAPGKLCAFTSPDCSLDVVLNALASSIHTVLLCSYEISSVPVCRALLDAKSRGVDVRLLVDGNPTGGMSSRQIDCISSMSASGVCVSSVCGNVSNDVVQHFSALHSKYAVIDDSTVIVLSENFVESGLPEDRIFGNRGWGVLVEDISLARFLSSMFVEDSRPSRLDVLDWKSDPRYDPSSVLPAEEPSRHSEGLLCPLRSTSEATVTLFPSPDCNLVGPFLASLIKDADEVVAEQFQSDLMWSTRWSDQTCVNPLLQGILEGLRSGASSQVLFDSSWFNQERNFACSEFLASVSANESLDGTFRLIDPRSPFSVVHNKGLVIDDSMSVVSSNNWVYPSFARNRELAAVIHSEEVALHFTRAFELDLYPDNSSPVALAGEDVAVEIGSSITLRGFASDDRLVADCWWDLDADGVWDVRGREAEFEAVTPGRHHAVMIVTDAWGNRANDSVTITVHAGSGPSSTTVRSPGTPPIWFVPMAVGCAVLLVRHLLRTRPRKINLPRRDFQ
ncbi:MAG TPA: phospholipase D-like domain-containing protein [Thermoplasmata archaeon]